MFWYICSQLISLWGIFVLFVPFRIHPSEHKVAALALLSCWGFAQKEIVQDSLGSRYVSIAVGKD